MYIFVIWPEKSVKTVKINSCKVFFLHGIKI